MRKAILRTALFLATAAFASSAWSQTPPTPAPAPPAVAAPAPAAAKPEPKKPFFLHAYHKEKLDGLECSLCHVAVKDGSVTLKRPGHEQCLTCHDDDFNKDLKQTVCAECHNTFPPTGADDLAPFPRYKGVREILSQFSHAAHVDKKARVDAKTGFRADCTFCHKFDPKGQFASFPVHEQCATCHSNKGAKPALTADLSAEGCAGCHNPLQTENPAAFGIVASTQARYFAGSHAMPSGKYVNIEFSHAPHFKAKEQFDLNCTTCHYSIPKSAGIKELSLPKMLDCVQCHDSARAVKAQFTMSNCKTCHTDPVSSKSMPTGHTRNVKPDFHTEAFRRTHEAEAAAPDAKCFVCHQNVTATPAAKATVAASQQCAACHQVMRPVSHTARWKDESHGKIAALDRTTCATCHTASYCSNCHNELPRSHAPLNLFKAGGHALPAQLDTRSCFTCHTFQNTCSECHVNKVVQNLRPAGTNGPLMAKADPATAKIGLSKVKPDLVGLFR